MQMAEFCSTSMTKIKNSGVVSDVVQTSNSNYQVCRPSLLNISTGRYQQMIVAPSGRLSRFFDSATSRILAILERPPTPWMIRNEKNLTQLLQPARNRIRYSFKDVSRRLDSSSARGIASYIPYKSVAGLVALNVSAFILLNSRFMKARSHVDGLPRVDRHFIASRYNVSHFRVWCVPLSIFNHGDSLMQLVMNCFGLSIVGPAVEIAFGPVALLGGFLFCGTVGALGEMALGNHWCRGSSAGVTGLLGMGAFASPFQLVSIWGVFDVRAASLAISIFSIESLIGLFGSGRSEMAHIAHAAGIASAIPALYYLRWFKLRR